MRQKDTWQTERTSRTQVKSALYLTIMWVRKPSWELQREREIRRRRYEIFVSFLVLVACVAIYWYVGSVDRFAEFFLLNPEGLISLVLLPLFIYLGYRNYVLHGSFWIERPGQICLACEKGMGYSDDGWGFKVYGRKKPKWHQVRACKTPEKCDIVYQFEVRWSNDEASEQSHNTSLKSD